MIGSPPGPCAKRSMYKVEYARSVVKDLKKLPKQMRGKALGIIEEVLAKDPFMGKPLSGLYKGLWKFRLGDYRIVYTIEEKRLVIYILRVRHRKDAYRGIVYK